MPQSVCASWLRPRDEIAALPVHVINLAVALQHPAPRKRVRRRAERFEFLARINHEPGKAVARERNAVRLRTAVPVLARTLNLVNRVICPNVPWRNFDRTDAPQH